MEHSKTNDAYPYTEAWIEFDFSGGHEMIQKRIPVYNAKFQAMGIKDFILHHIEGETNPLKKYYIQTCSNRTGWYINPDKPIIGFSADHVAQGFNGPFLGKE